jgi:hypothetical protein
MMALRCCSSLRPRVATSETNVSLTPTVAARDRSRAPESAPMTTSEASRGVMPSAIRKTWCAFCGLSPGCRETGTGTEDRTVCNLLPDVRPRFADVNNPAHDAVVIPQLIGKANHMVNTPESRLLASFTFPPRGGVFAMRLWKRCLLKRFAISTVG